MHIHSYTHTHIEVLHGYYTMSEYVYSQGLRFVWRLRTTCKPFYTVPSMTVQLGLPDAGTGMEKVPSHFVGCKSVVVFFVIGHCQRILFLARLNYGT